jgi:hypothetical protein
MDPVSDLSNPLFLDYLSDTPRITPTATGVSMSSTSTMVSTTRTKTMHVSEDTFRL